MTAKPWAISSAARRVRACTRQSCWLIPIPTSKERASTHPTGLGASILVCLVLAGCGSREVRGTISGRVTFQDAPVTAGIVMFSNDQKGVHMSAKLAADGTYRVVTAQGAGLPLGTYRVAVAPPLLDAPTGVFTGPPKYPDAANIPPRYRDPKTSGLTLNVHQGDNPFDIRMQP